jgi:hypothetical protein
MNVIFAIVVMPIITERQFRPSPEESVAWQCIYMQTGESFVQYFTRLPFSVQLLRVQKVKCDVRYERTPLRPRHATVQNSYRKFSIRLLETEGWKMSENLIIVSNKARSEFSEETSNRAQYQKLVFTLRLKSRLALGPVYSPIQLVFLGCWTCRSVKLTTHLHL